MAEPPLNLALTYAAAGWPVFPCDPASKKPFTLHGFKDARGEAAEVERFWRRWPDAMVGVPTGAGSGFWAVDLDVSEGKDGIAALGQLGELPTTLAQETPSGGRHVLFRWDPDRPVRNTSSKLGPGIDTRGEGGYVVMAGSVRADGGAYAWLTSPDAVELADAPEWLYALLAAPPEPVRPWQRDRGADRARTSYALAALDDECSAVAAAPRGARNDQLNTSAFKMGTLVGAGALAEEPARQALLEAADRCGLPTGEAHKTVQSGLSAGQQRPRDLPAARDASAPVLLSPRTAAQTTSAIDPDSGAVIDPETGEVFEDAPALVRASELHGREVPPRLWHVPQLMPSAAVTLLGGAGAVGKSRLALQLAVATVGRRDWLRHQVAEGPVIYLSAEDPLDELHRRLHDTCLFYDLQFSSLGQLHLWDLANQDATLVRENTRNRTLEPTDRFSQLESFGRTIRPSLIVLDSLADVFAGDENSRAHVRRFVGLLRRLATDLSAAVLLLAHPSRAGLNDGSGMSGSTAWENSVRSRLYFDKLRADGVDLDPDVRVLSLKKANYAPAQMDIRLRARLGGYEIEGDNPASPLIQSTVQTTLDQLFLDLLDNYAAQRRNVSPHTGHSFAPAIFARDPAAKGANRKALTSAMNRLFAAGRIEVEQVGPPSRSVSRLVRSAPGGAE